MFIETPNTETFQCRYVIHYPASGDLSCDAGKQYLQDLSLRKQRELQELRALTGWSRPDFMRYLKKSDYVPHEPEKKEEGKAIQNSNKDEEPPSQTPSSMAMLNLLLLALTAIAIIRLPHISER